MIIYQNFRVNNNLEEELASFDTNFDILNPTFTINSEQEKIIVTAENGNFINSNQILLKNNVFFESENFKIFSDEVTFNKKDQTAESNSKSKFESSGTKITSEGFRIIQQGNIIYFNGKTSLVITQ